MEDHIHTKSITPTCFLLLLLLLHGRFECVVKEAMSKRKTKKYTVLGLRERENGSKKMWEQKGR